AGGTGSRNPRRPLPSAPGRGEDRRVLAITGPLPRRAESFALLVTALAALVTVVVPVLYVVLLPAVCAAVAISVPDGHRLAAAMAVWAPLSLAAAVGVLPI